MLIGSLISFGVMFLAWIVLPVREMGEEPAVVVAPEKMASSRQSA